MNLPDGLDEHRDEVVPGSGVAIEPYKPGSHECCCGDPGCNEFEERMAAWGIPLDEITTVTWEEDLE
jgi:hypothetical protein